MNSRKKPFLMIFIMCYTTLGALLVIPVGLFLLIAGQGPGLHGLLLSIAGILLCVFGFIMLASVYGLWSLQEWGRKLIVGISIISIPLGALSIFPIWPGQEFSFGNTVLQLCGIGLSVFIIYYVTRTTIKTLFERNSS